jgi:hypothetical protein
MAHTINVGTTHPSPETTTMPPQPHNNGTLPQLWLLHQTTLPLRNTQPELTSPLPKYDFLDSKLISGTNLIHF